MWKIAWGVVLGLILWHTLPLIVAGFFGLLLGLSKPHDKHGTPASAPYGNGAKPRTTLEAG